MGSSAKNYKPNGDTTIIGGVLNVVGDGQIQKDGVPVDLGGGGGSVAWADVTGKPAVIAAGADQAEAREAIGAGTSNLAIGTTASTAAAGNHTHAASAITVAASTGLTGDNVQAALADLAARVAALEAAAE